MIFNFSTRRVHLVKGTTIPVSTPQTFLKSGHDPSGPKTSSTPVILSHSISYGKSVFVLKGPSLLPFLHPRPSLSPTVSSNLLPTLHNVV